MYDFLWEITRILLLIGCIICLISIIINFITTIIIRIKGFNFITKNIKTIIHEDKNNIKKEDE